MQTFHDSAVWEPKVNTEFLVQAEYLNALDFGLGSATVTLEMLCLLVADKSLSLGASKMVGGLLKMEL